MTMARTTTSDEGRFINLAQSLLVIHPNLEHQAYQLLETEFEVDTANNNRSTVVRSRSGLNAIIVPWLSSTTAWSVHAGPGQNSLVWNDRMDLEFGQTGDNATKDRLHDACYRASVMFSEWRNNFGSNA
jgi:hypothetical protein